MNPKQMIAQFDDFLVERKLEFEAVVVGGTALALLGVISRETRDCDILIPELPEKVKEASQDFAKHVSEKGLPLDRNWLNNGPSSLIQDLPSGWMNRTHPLFSGKAIHLRSLGRLDLLRSKLFALCDRSLDLQDCIALRPTQKEIDLILPWLKERDGNPDWSEHVENTCHDLIRRVNDGV
jgi:hypothetical protein